MYFDNLQDFLTMEGHGLYVWLAYAIALVVLVFNIAAPLVRKRQLLQDQARQMRREARRGPLPEDGGQNP